MKSQHTVMFNDYKNIARYFITNGINSSFTTYEQIEILIEDSPFFSGHVAVVHVSGNYIAFLSYNSTYNLFCFAI